MLQAALAAEGIAFTSFEFSENTGQMQPIREQAGTFADTIKLWGRVVRRKKASILHCLTHPLDALFCSSPHQAVGNTPRKAV
jgi:hypothetical protein